MAYTITKLPDGDVNFGSLNGEFVNLQPAVSDYPTGGYPIIDGETVVNTPTKNANCDMYKVLAALPVSGQSGLVPQFNAGAKTLALMEQNGTTGGLAEVPAGTDLSKYTFELLLIGL